MQLTGSVAAPMNIVMGGRSLLTPRTGIGQYVHHLEQGMAALGHQVRFFYGTHWGPSAPATGSSAVQQAVKLTLRNRLSGKARRLARDYVPGLWRVAPLIEQIKFNAGVRSAGRPQIYHEPNFIPVRCASPTVITAHDVSWVRHPEYHPAARLTWMRHHFSSATRRSDRIIVVSDFVRRELLECFSVDPAKVRVVYNGVSDAFVPHTPVQTRAVLDRHGLTHGAYMVAVGTLEPRKNLGTALDAHERLPAAVQRACPLVLIGVNGWLNDDLHARLRRPVQAGTVRVLGYVPDAELPALVAGARALLYPSVYEGFGLPPLEAMASSVPVIASTAGAVQEVVADAGLLHEAQDVEAFTESMQRVIEDKALCERLGTAGRARARHFTWRRCVQETLAVYGELVD